MQYGVLAGYYRAINWTSLVNEVIEHRIPTTHTHTNQQLIALRATPMKSVMLKPSLVLAP